ncbi:5-hydroxytryptamine receptor 7-like [Oculina patagonica]
METWFWILGWFLSILTMTGNGFVIFTVCGKRKLRTKTNAFIVSLAVADFCVGMSLVPPMFICDKVSKCDSQGVSSKVLVSLSELFSIASGMSLCTLVLDRYIAIVKPLKYLTFMKRRRVIQTISLSWTISVSFTLFVRSLIYSYETSLVMQYVIDWFYTVLELFTCAIVIFCFASMLIVVYKHDRSARILAKQLRFNQRAFFKTQDKSAIKMMAIVVCLFLVCYGIALRCNFVRIFSGHKLCYDIQYKLPIVVLNSAVNPLAYAIFKRDIQKELTRLIYSVIHKKV